MNYWSGYLDLTVRHDVPESRTDDYDINGRKLGELTIEFSSFV
jgi:hypothetical protein